MPKQKNGQGLVLPKLAFNTAAGNDGCYFIYCIWNRAKDKYYVGISRHPVRRVRENLQDKSGLSDDYRQYQRMDSKRENREDRTFQFFILGQKTGYKDVLVACLTEVLFMLHIQKNGKSLYNRNYFGGHRRLSELDHGQEAFQTAVHVLLAGPGTPHVSYEQISALGLHLPDLRRFVDSTGDGDILNSGVLKLFETAWDKYLRRLKSKKLGHMAAPHELVAFPAIENILVA